MTDQLKFEIKRKLFHATSLIFPIMYIYNSKTYILNLLIFFTILVLILDIGRNYSTKLNNFILKIFNSLIRKGEFSSGFKLSSMSYMMLGMLATAIFFPKGLVINSWLVLIVSDSLASILGNRFGVSEIIPYKTTLGSVVFFVSAIFVSLLSVFIINYNTSFLIIMLSCFVATLAELFSRSIGVDDNLSIPISFALTTILFLKI